MLMKKLVTYLSIVCCWIAWLSTASCTQNEENTEVNDTSTLYVTFSTRASEPDPLLRHREGIRTLRLILIQEGKVLRNYQEDFGADGQPVIQKTITFLGIPNKDISIYAIANEESVNLDFSRISVGSVFDDIARENLTGTVIDNTGRKFFPRTEEALTEANRYLPMTGKAEYKMVTGKKEQQVSVELTRMVAKMEIIFKNETGADLLIDKIHFGKGPSPTKTFLFPKENQLPEGTVYNDNYVATGGAILPMNGEGIMVDYFCESNAGAGHYQLGLNDLTDFPLTNIIDTETKQPVAFLWRNTCLRVTATAKVSGWELKCSVLPWDYTETEVDYETQLSYTQGTWDKQSYLNREGNKIQLFRNPERTPAVITFTIQTPNTATWQASLTDPMHFEFVEGFDSGKAVDETGKPVKQTIKIRVKDPDSQESYETQLKVHAIIAGKSYEINLVGEGSSTTDERFTIIQSN